MCPLGVGLPSTAMPASARSTFHMGLGAQGQVESWVLPGGSRAVGFPSCDPLEFRQFFILPARAYLQSRLWEQMGSTACSSRWRGMYHLPSGP